MATRAPLTPESFREALYSHRHGLPELRWKLLRVPPTQRADALLGVFTDPARAGYGDQQVAGQLLLALAPEPHRPLDDILRMAAPSWNRSVEQLWNRSVEQLPYYMRQAFGEEVVLDTARRLARPFPSDSPEAQALKTVRWWLGRRGDEHEEGA